MDNSQYTAQHRIVFYELSIYQVTSMYGSKRELGFSKGCEDVIGIRSRGIWNTYRCRHDRSLKQQLGRGC